MSLLAENYNLIEKIGKGSYGKIFKAQRKRDGLVLALKRIDVANLSAPEQTDTLNEVSLMAQLEHEHIVRFYDAFMEDNAIFIAMELIEGGDLGAVIDHHKVLRTYVDEAEIWQYLVEACCGLKYLHDRRMLHRDLKPQNIMLTADRHVKIVDFGFTKHLGQNQLAMSVVGTPLYMSPELCKKCGYDDRSDVWSLGCIFYELMSLRLPFVGREWDDLTDNIANQTPAPLPEHYSADLVAVVEMMMDKDKERRPDLAALMATPAFRPHLLALKTVNPTEEDESAIWRELAATDSGARNMAAQLTWLVRRLAEARRECRTLQEQLSRAQAEAAEATAAASAAAASAAAAATRGSLGVDLGDSSDQSRPKHLVYRKDCAHDDGADSSGSESDSGSEGEGDEEARGGAEQVTEMMETLDLNTPAGAKQPRSRREGTSTSGSSGTNGNNRSGSAHRSGAHSKTLVSGAPIASTPVKAGTSAGRASTKMVPFTAEYFGLVPMLGAGSSINAVYAWRKQERGHAAPADRRVRCSPVWAGREAVALLVPTPEILVLARTAAGAGKRLWLRHISVGYTGEHSLVRSALAPDDTRPLPVLAQQPDRSVWHYAVFRGRAPIAEVVLDFDNANLATEVVVVRGHKLAPVLAEHERRLAASPARAALKSAAAPAAAGASGAVRGPAGADEAGDIIADQEQLQRMTEDMLQATQIFHTTLSTMQGGGSSGSSGSAATLQS